MANDAQIPDSVSDAPPEVVDAASEIARATLVMVREAIAEHFPDADLDRQKDFV